MDRARPGRRRASSEIVTEGKRKKSSPADLQKMTKLLTVKSEDVLTQSPLPKLRGSECWDFPLEGWTRSLRNKVICLDHKNTKAAHGCPKALPKRHLRVMLTNVLWTDLGREFRKTLPRNDANLCDTSKVQSDSLPSTSVDSIETCQRLDPLHQSLNLSERIPRVILTDIRQTELGRKYLKKIPSVTEACVNDTAHLKSEQLSSSSDGSLESCQKVNHHKSFLSERTITTDRMRSQANCTYALPTLCRPSSAGALLPSCDYSSGLSLQKGKPATSSDMPGAVKLPLSRLLVL